MRPFPITASVLLYFNGVWLAKLNLEGTKREFLNLRNALYQGFLLLNANNKRAFIMHYIDFINQCLGRLLDVPASILEWLDGVSTDR